MEKLVVEMKSHSYKLATVKHHSIAALILTNPARIAGGLPGWQ